MVGEMITINVGLNDQVKSGLVTADVYTVCLTLKKWKKKFKPLEIFRLLKTFLLCLGVGYWL